MSSPLCHKKVLLFFANFKVCETKMLYVLYFIDAKLLEELFTFAIKLMLIIMFMHFIVDF